MISQTAIDNQLYELEKQYWKHRGCPEDYRYHWLLYAVNRHISTGRASTAWLKLFLSADIEKLTEECHQYAGSDDQCMKAVNRFLKYSHSD